mgnify:CR=1 FL=1
MSQACLQKIRQIISNQTKCRKNTIHEKSLHDEYERQKTVILIDQIEAIPNAGRHNNIERKVSKDRCEHIKIKSTTKSIR